MEKTKHPSDLFQDTWNKDYLTEKLKTEDMPDFPLDKIEFHISGKCNLSCSFCYGLKYQPKENMFLDCQSIFKVLNDVKEINPLILFAGMYSEPLLHPDFVEIMTQVEKYGYRFGIYSNAFLLTDEKINAIIKAAKTNRNENPSYISFNITASIDINKFDEQVEKIKRLIDKKDDSLIVNATLLSLEGKDDYDFLLNVVDKLNEIGIDNIRLSTPWNEQQLGEIKGLSTLNKLEKACNKVTVRYNRDFDKCYAMAMAISISPDGSVFPCPAVCSPLFKDRYSYGNIYETSILELWRGKAHKCMYNQLDPRKDKCRCCPMDYRFNAYCNELK